MCEKDLTWASCNHLVSFNAVGQDKTNGLDATMFSKPSTLKAFITGQMSDPWLPRVLNLTPRSLSEDIHYSPPPSSRTGLKTLNSLIRSLLNNVVAPTVIRQNNETPMTTFIDFILTYHARMSMFSTVIIQVAASAFVEATSSAIYTITEAIVPSTHFSNSVIKLS